MPTNQDNAYRVLRALCSSGDVTLDELDPPDFPPRGGWRFTVSRSIVLDSKHADTVRGMMECVPTVLNGHVTALGSGVPTASSGHVVSDGLGGEDGF